MAEFDIVKGISSVCQRINAVCLKNKLDVRPRLVAVSKIKPKEMIIAAYNEGLRHFGENYIKELVEKSHEPDILEKCKDIKWHFIGNLQRNKVNKLVTVPSLFVVETIDSEKLATALNNAWEKCGKPEPLNIMVQVNTSNEEEKGGCEPENCVKLVEFIMKSCPRLKFMGLMTIGKYGYDPSTEPNPDFLCLRKCRGDVCAALSLAESEVELSMGMSADYEQAIELGSTSVRVGTSIFGVRETKNEDKMKIAEGVKNLSVQ